MSVVNTVNIHEAKTHLSRLVEQAAKGREFVIAKAGKPMVRVVPVQAPLAAQKPGISGRQGHDHGRREGRNCRRH
jgi:prevent-host-death family protein